MKKSYLKLAALFLIAFLYVCYQQFFVQQNAKADTFYEVILTAPNGDEISVKSEIAADNASRNRGLMYRREMAASEGMLFLWKDSAPRSFWMKNTYIPLDMIFIEGTNIIGIVKNAEPKTLTPRTVEGHANAVLEVNAGFTDMYKINKDWKVSYAISDVEVK